MKNREQQIEVKKIIISSACFAKIFVQYPPPLSPLQSSVAPRSAGEAEDDLSLEVAGQITLENLRVDTSAMLLKVAFNLTLIWRDSRAVFLNLKEDSRYRSVCLFVYGGGVHKASVRLCSRKGPSSVYVCVCMLVCVCVCVLSTSKDFYRGEQSESESGSNRVSDSFGEISG